MEQDLAMAKGLQWQNAFTARMRQSPMISMTIDSRLTQCCVPMVVTITFVNCMNEAGGCSRF